MIIEEEENCPCLCSKSQTLYTGPPLHRWVIWSKHMDANNEIIFSVMFFLRAVELGKGTENFFKIHFQSKVTKVLIQITTVFFFTV